MKNVLSEGGAAAFNLTHCAFAFILCNSFPTTSYALGSAVSATPARESQTVTVPQITAPPGIQSDAALDYYSVASGDRHHFALGLALGVQQRAEYGTGIHKKVHPELVGFYYLFTGLKQFWGRLGLRASYVDDQPEMPQNLQIVEKDSTFSAEAAILFDWYVVPSFSFGSGLLYRTIRSSTKEPIAPGNAISINERIPLYFVQVGLGLPLLEGRFLVEPFFRKFWVPNDSRMKDLYGFEGSVRIF